MADPREIKIVIRAEDDYSAAMKKFNAELNGLGLSTGRVAESSDKVSRELNKLTSASEYVGGGLKKVRNIIEGMAFGGAIGLVSGAVAVLTEEFVKYYKESINTAEKINKLNESVHHQAEAWKLLPAPMNTVTQATISLYNAQLKYLQLSERGAGDILKKQIADLEQMSRASEINMRALPGRAADLEKEVANFNITIAEAKVKLEQWKQLMDLTPTSVLKVADSLADADKKIADTLTGTEGFAALHNFINLSMPPEKAGFDGEVLGKKFGEGFVSGAQQTLDINTLHFSMGFIHEGGTGAATNAYFAEIDQIYKHQSDLEDALLDRHLGTSEAMVTVEMSTQQKIMNLRFAAGNQAAALLTVLGGKHKEVAYVALALQKGLAMAQVFIESKVASMAALLPPPIGLGPVAGIPLSASIETWGYINMALIAATGIAEGATIGGGGAGPSGIGGGGGIGALPIQAPDISPDARPSQSITIIIHNPLSEQNWEKITQDNIIPAINSAADRDVNIVVRTQ